MSGESSTEYSQDWDANNQHDDEVPVSGRHVHAASQGVELINISDDSTPTTGVDGDGEQPHSQPNHADVGHATAGEGGAEDEALAAKHQQSINGHENDVDDEVQDTAGDTNNINIELKETAVIKADPGEDALRTPGKHPRDEDDSTLSSHHTPESTEEPSVSKKARVSTNEEQ